MGAWGVFPRACGVYFLDNCGEVGRDHVATYLGRDAPEDLHRSARTQAKVDLQAAQLAPRHVQHRLNGRKTTREGRMHRCKNSGLIHRSQAREDG